MKSQQEQTELSQAEKQASESFRNFNFFESLEESYKTRTRLFFKWNKELAQEPLKAGEGNSSKPLLDSRNKPPESTDKEPSPNSLRGDGK